MCIITEKLKERFCKDLNLPIKVFGEPYFSERLVLYDKQYHCLAKYNEFIDLVNRCGGEQQYFALYNSVKDSAISYLNENSVMNYFSCEEDFSKYQIKNIGFPKRDIYHSDNDGKCFISFDMRKGNFTALHHYSPEIVANCNTYEEFLGLFTKESHLIYSKYIRQVIFGNINPRRQVAYEQYLMDIVLTKVLEYFDRSSVVFFSTDEIVVEIHKHDAKYFKKVADDIVDFACGQNIFIRAEVFTLHKIVNTSGFVKKFLFDDKVDIKGINSIQMPFVLHYLNKTEPTENDKVFLYENVLCKLLDAPNISVDFKGD